MKGKGPEDAMLLVAVFSERHLNPGHFDKHHGKKLKRMLCQSLMTAFSSLILSDQYTSFRWIQMLWRRPRQAMVMSRKDPA